MKRDRLKTSMEQLAAYYAEFQIRKQTCPLTEPQYRQLMSYFTTQDEPLSLISDLLGRPVEHWSEIYAADYPKLKIYIHQHSPINTMQINILKDRYDQLDQLSFILKRPLDSYSQIYYGEYLHLLQAGQSFTGLSNDTPLIQTDRYEYGIQQERVDVGRPFLFPEGRMAYLRFYDLMMLDYDGNITYETMLSYLEPYLAEFRFRIYDTANGYHVFILSHHLNSSHPASLALMNQLKCDPHYTMFCHKHGYKVRLTAKLSHQTDYIAKFRVEIGAGPVDVELKELMDLHDQYLIALPNLEEKFKATVPK